MRRRVRSSDPPPRLRIFRADDWPGDPAAAHAAWCREREAWAEVHGWPGGPDGWAAARIEAAAQTPDAPWSPEEV